MRPPVVAGSTPGEALLQALIGLVRALIGRVRA
jgi:hypothetical protein